MNGHSAHHSSWLMEETHIIPSRCFHSMMYILAYSCNSIAESLHDWDTSPLFHMLNGKGVAFAIRKLKNVYFDDGNSVDLHILMYLFVPSSFGLQGYTSYTNHAVKMTVNIVEPSALISLLCRNVKIWRSSYFSLMHHSECMPICYKSSSQLQARERHICMYIYRRNTLIQFCHYPVSSVHGLYTSFMVKRSEIWAS